MKDTTRHGCLPRPGTFAACLFLPLLFAPGALQTTRLALLCACLGLLSAAQCQARPLEAESLAPPIGGTTATGVASSGAVATKPPAPPPLVRKAGDAATPADRGIGRHKGILKMLAESSKDYGLVLIGDSITDMWPKKGADTYTRLAPYKPLNLGVSGDRTEHVLHRLLNGELEGLKPKAVMILIGTNNLGSSLITGEQPAWVVEGVARIVETVRERLPGARVLLLGVFPRGEKPDDPYRAKIAEINQSLAGLADGDRVKFLDLGARFLAADGTLPHQVMPDFLHPGPRGYELWLEAVLPTLEEMMK